MELNGIREAIKEILELVASVPEEYRMKTYEILLTQYLIGEEIARSSVDHVDLVGEPVEGEEYIAPIDVRAFLTQYGIDESILRNLFLIDKSGIRSIYKISTTVKSQAQIQVACLTALENALTSGRFCFSVEDVRQRLRDFKSYDKINFSTNFKNNEGLFKKLGEDEVELSSEGKSELADIIVEITS